jgi:hypothetical protein
MKELLEGGGKRKRKKWRENEEELQKCSDNAEWRYPRLVYFLRALKKERYA